MRFHRSLSWVLVLCGSMAHAGDPKPAARVVELDRSSPAGLYERLDGDRFTRVGELDPAQIRLPATVLAVSPRGYVQVETAAGLVWLDEMEIEIETRVPASVTCRSVPSVSRDTTMAASMGAGKACR